MEDSIARFFENLMGRVGGPMTFRLILQPLMAIFFAVRSGLKDAKESKPAYFWALFSDPVHRKEMVRDGWKSVGRVFVFAIIMDLIYQLIVFRWFYPGETLVVAFILAIVPYVLLRGPVNRLTSRKGKEKKQ
jgi:hypothetical protein